MPQRCWVENAMPQWNAGASRHLRIDFVITTTLTSMESVWHLAQREGSIRAARTLIKWRKKKKKKMTSIVEGGKLDVILSDHHTGPVSYQAEDLSSPLNFSGLMKRPDTGLIKNERKKNYGNTKWGEMRLWSSAFWYLVESLCNNLLSSTILSPLNLDSCRPAEKKEVREGIQYAELQCTKLKVKNKKQVCNFIFYIHFP